MASTQEKALLKKLATERGRAAWPTRLALLGLWRALPEHAEAALDQLKAAVAEDPRHFEAWVALFERALKHGQMSLASQALEQAALTAPSPAERARRWVQLGALLSGKSLSEADDISDDETEERTVRGQKAEPAPPPAVDLKLSAEDASVRDRCIHAMDEDPLDPGGYEGLAALLRKVGDAPRGKHLEAVARALLGQPSEEVEQPVPVRSADRGGLRHPSLRTADGELIALAAPVLLAFTQQPTSGFPGSPFRKGAGPGAEGVALSLDAAEQALAMTFAHVRVSDELYPAFRFCASKGLRVEVGRQALRAPQPEPRLRFEAGRALFSQTPDLLVLLHLGADAIRTMLGGVDKALRGGRRLPADAQRALGKLGERRQRRLKALIALHLPSLDYGRLRRAARFSTHRAGLVVSGDVGASLASLRSLGAQEDEQIQFIRFAASERYFQLRATAPQQRE